MGDLKYSANGEFETAVAAAAYAIVRKEESYLNSKVPIKELNRTMSRNKSKRQDSMSKPIDRRMTRWFSGTEARDGRQPGKNKDDLRRAPSAIKPALSFPGKGNEATKRTRSTEAEKRADAWQKEKMAKIQMRYENMKATILEWENDKKMKAKRRIDGKKSEPESKRARALQEYRNELSRIDDIAGAARALAEEKRRDEEARAREKADKIRLTGRVPRTCFCF